MSETWQDRLQDYATLTSPSGKVYSAYWRGDTLDVEKRLGKFDYPGADGTRVQDLATVSDIYALTLFFEGADHDKTAREFRTSLKERGPWTVVHPVEGSHKLQLVKATFHVDPTDSANVTQVDSSWIEPLQDSQTTSLGDTAKKMTTAGDAAANAAATSLAGVDVSSPSKLAALVSGVQSSIQAISNQVKAASAQFNAIKDQITATLSATVLDTLSLAGDVIALAKTPWLIVGDIESQLNSFGKIASSLLDELSGLDDSPESRNIALVVQTFATAVLDATMDAITTTEPATRGSALASISTMSGMVGDLISGLDTSAALFQGSIDTQYFASGDVVDSWLDMLSLSQAYLLALLFDLKTETTITLDRARATYEIAITEYGANAGNADDYYDFLCQSNDFHGMDILWLAAGRQVVIYG